MDATLLEGLKKLKIWRQPLAAMIDNLRSMAGSTESDFLVIGSRLQDVYQRTIELTQTADELVQVASGEKISDLVSGVHRIVDKMGIYLAENQLAGERGTATLDTVRQLLRQIAPPLDSYKKMSKNLYMLEVSIKIESSYLGELGSEFITLALDIKKLTIQIKEKANDLCDHRELLDSLVHRNIARLLAMQKSQRSALDASLGNMNRSIDSLQEVNAHFAALGQQVAAISSENAQHLSNMVQSMQFHDIFRQQVEHVIEGLAGLEEPFQICEENENLATGERLFGAMGRIGDMCELQQAQLQFATSDFNNAVTTIIDSLHEIGGQQGKLAANVLHEKGVRNRTAGSFIDEVTGFTLESSMILEGCAKQNSATVEATREVARTVQQMTEYVSIIEEIGAEITSISLNARIKAAGTGDKGGSLSVLAEEIAYLSNDSVSQAEAITTSLTTINEATTTLSTDVHDLESNLSEKLTDLKKESEEILAALTAMSSSITGFIEQARNQSQRVAKIVEALSGSIGIHERIQRSAGKALDFLQEMHRTARGYSPASANFKEELRRMADSYTMESERRIHEAISGLHGASTAENRTRIEQKTETASEFGDNVDLF